MRTGQIILFRSRQSVPGGSPGSVTCQQAFFYHRPERNFHCIRACAELAYHVPCPHPTLIAHVVEDFDGEYPQKAFEEQARGDGEGEEETTASSGAVLELETKNWYDPFELACDVRSVSTSSGTLVAGHLYQYYGGNVSDDKGYDYNQATGLAFIVCIEVRASHTCSAPGDRNHLPNLHQRRSSATGRSAELL